MSALAVGRKVQHGMLWYLVIAGPRADGSYLVQQPKSGRTFEYFPAPKPYQIATMREVRP